MAPKRRGKGKNSGTSGIVNPGSEEKSVLSSASIPAGGNVQTSAREEPEPFEGTPCPPPGGERNIHLQNNSAGSATRSSASQVHGEAPAAATAAFPAPCDDSDTGSNPTQQEHSNRNIGTMSWEETGQFALNASILTGRFEDLRLVAMSKRLPTGVVCQPRALYANSALVSRALSNSSLLIAGRDNSDVDGTNPRHLLMHYEYIDDSDLEDSDLEDDTAPKSPMDITTESEAPTGGEAPQGGHLSDREAPESHYSSASSRVATPALAPGEKQGAIETIDPTELPSGEKTSEFKPSGAYVGKDRPAPRNHSPAVEDATTTAGVEQSGRAEPIVKRDEMIQTIFLTDTAYRTWRAFVFYAYTGRIAFAPLRSQASKLVPDDDLHDATQLPICSPKSVYRLAVKYGNPQLALLAGNDLAAKLSTQNALEELFSRFTAAHPTVQDMELNFVLAHLKHPDITVRLPTWVSRFAHGELKECADTFERLIHKLACATIDPAVSAICPKGCAMPTIQHRCAMCGWMFN